MLKRRQVLQGGLSVILVGAAASAAPKVGFGAVNTEDAYSTVIDPTSKTFNIYATDLTLSGQHIPLDMKTIIRADRIVLTDTVRTNGNDIIVFARELVVASGGSIDTKGPAANPDYTARPPAPSGDRGQPGDNGENGGSGPAGGNIQIFAGRITGRLTLDTSGRNGGAAQAGGRGGDGIIGAAGGGAGGPPAQGGSAGTPGRGGDAGRILLRYLQSEAQPVVSATHRAGLHGAPAPHGMPGTPGPGGPGGVSQKCSRVCNPEPP